MWTLPSTICRRFFALLPAALLMLPYPLSAQPRPLTADWSFDVLRLKNGKVFKGMLLEETNFQVRFQNVYRVPGRPTVWITVTLGRNEIERVDKLPDAERAVLKARLSELDPKGEGERRRMEQLNLKVADWNGKPNAALRYDSDYFSLCSNAPEEIVRRCAVHLEEVYTAYARFLPPRCKGGNPTMITLVPSLKEYREMLKEQERKLQNPAFYEPGANRIFCGNNVQKLGEDLAHNRRVHQGIRQEIDKTAAEFRKLFAKNPRELEIRLGDLEDKRKVLARADKNNEQIFQKEMQQLFSILNHEAFHAYVANFVYPPVKDKTLGNTPGELPRWLNEGLAQIFETALVEAGELRVDQADKDRLARAKDAIRAKELMPLKEVLNSGAKQFIVVHKGDRPGSDQAYLTSWALTSYLALDRRLLGSPALEAYVRAVNNGGKVEEAFAKMVGQELPAFEKDFHLWVTRIKPDGSLAQIKGK